MKKILLVSVLVPLLFVLLKPQPVFSQGVNEFGCRLLPGPGGGCSLGPENCDPGCAVTDDCTHVSGPACNTTVFPCDCPGPTSPPGGGGGNVPSANINFPSLIQIAAPAFAGKTIGDIIYALLPYIFSITGFLLLLYIIWGGFQILTSQGDPKRLAAGQEKITGAIIGLLIIFVAFWIVYILSRILGLQPIIDIFR